MKYANPVLFFIFISFLLISTAFAQQSDESNLYRLAQTYEQAGQHETALRYYQDLFRRQPNNPTYFDGVRRTLTQLKRYPELVELINQRLKLSPNDIMLRAYLGSALYRMGKEEDAFNVWEAAITINPSNTSVYRMLADQAIDNKLYKKAVDYLLRARKAGGNNLLFVPEIARAYALQMNYRDAMNEYVNLLITSPTMLNEIEHQLTQYTSIAEGMATALNVVKSACDDNRDNIQLRHLYAWLAMEKKEYATAYEVYKEIDKLQRSHGAELLAFARRAYSEKIFSVAMKAFQDVMDRDVDERNTPEAEFYYVRCIEAVNDQTDSALVPSELQPFHTSYPSTESVPNYAGAVSLYEKIVKKYPTHPVGLEAMYRIGYLKFTRFNDVDGAMTILRQCADMRRQILGNPDADILIGDIFVAQGKLDEARKQYEQVNAFPIMTPDQKRSVEYKLAELLYFMGKFDDALSKLQPLMENSNADIANDALSLSMFIMDNRKPTDAPLREYAKAALYDRQRKYSEAAAILQSVLTTFPSAIIIDRSYIYLAEMQRRSGQYNAAVQTLQTFISKYPESVVRDNAQFDLGELYYTTLHDNTRALELYQNLLKDFPNSLLSTEARKRILSLRQSNP